MWVWYLAWYVFLSISYVVLTCLNSASRLRYEITSGNFGGAFSVDKTTGAIKVARPLDYETRQNVSWSHCRLYRCIFHKENVFNIIYAVSWLKLEFDVIKDIRELDFVAILTFAFSLNSSWWQLIVWMRTTQRWWFTLTMSTTALRSSTSTSMK